MSILVRKATRGDVLGITALLSGYMHEPYSAEWRGEPIAIDRDGFGIRFHSGSFLRHRASFGACRWSWFVRSGIINVSDVFCSDAPP
jgi:hypothetical protein